MSPGREAVCGFMKDFGEQWHAIPLSKCDNKTLKPLFWRWRWWMHNCQFSKFFPMNEGESACTLFLVTSNVARCSWLNAVHSLRNILKPRIIPIPFSSINIMSSLIIRWEVICCLWQSSRSGFSTKILWLNVGYFIWFYYPQEQLDMEIRLFV